ncbi:MAG: hypothetical protein VR69_11740 [Peptococcaceae bacterium BRH_c4b]|nr:MAG: hypothetical protein VR69_11740 [Peptococcaceae bacterium BRH_c4b]
MSLGFEEKLDNLTIRINAHIKYSNFSLESWLEDVLPIKEGDQILDIGCGSGNFFSIYHKMSGGRGIIVGIDQSEELLFKATKQPIPKILVKWNMDYFFPFIDCTFDFIISTYAIYYATNIKVILEEINRLLKQSCMFYLLGPSINNAKELYVFNEMVFSFPIYNEAIIRTSRLENDFFHESNLIFKNVNLERVQRKLVFPDKYEFIKYYKATPLYEESVAKAGYVPSDEILFSIKQIPLEISKEMILLKGEKK